MFYRKPRLLAIFSFSALIAGFSQFTLADWSLDGDASSLFYVTSKAAAVSELNTFAELSGSIDADGKAEVSISLASVDTAIDIRNERMREIVFQVASYPVATVTLDADGSRLASLGAGETLSETYDATISLHGTEAAVSLEVIVSGLKDGGLLVSLSRPLIINAASFGLADAVEELRGIAGLPSINNNVVVDFTLQFDADS